MKKALLLAMAAFVALSFGACQTSKTASGSANSGDQGDCCKSDAQPVKKLRFR